MRRSTSSSSLFPRVRTAAPVAGTVLALSLALSACGGGAKEKDDEPAKKETPAAVEKPTTWPLTGLEAKDAGAVVKSHPIFVVKIDNSGKGVQTGLSKADLVFEQLVEGGTTRLAAFYYSKLPDVVGPVRSMRATDVGIIGDTDAHVITSGAAGVTINRINKAGITFHEEGAEGISRDPARRPLYNVVVNLKEAAAAVKAEAARPDDYFAFGTPADLPAGEPASALDVSFGNHTTSWAFGKETWKNTNTNAPEGDTFKPDTVLVLRVEVEDAGYKDPGGAFVPESVFDGTGEAQLFHGGKVVTGTWTKDGLDGALTLEADGKELKVPAGRTWVELLPTDGKVTFTP